MKHASNIEFLDVLHENGSPAGYALSREDVHRKGLWHRTVHVWIVNSSDELLIQKRSLHKKTYPGLWDISCAGHICAGDNSTYAALKEMYEELGIILNKKQLQYLFTLNRSFDAQNKKFIENEITDVYLVNADLSINKFTLQKEELSQVVYISINDLKNKVHIKSPEFAPHDEEYKLLFEKLDKFKN